MTKITEGSPLATFFSRIGYTGAKSGTAASLYPEDVAFLQDVVTKALLECAAKATKEAEEKVLRWQMQCQAYADDLCELNRQANELRQRLASAEHMMKYGKPVEGLTVGPQMTATEVLERMRATKHWLRP